MYASFETAVAKHPAVDVVVNFMSMRSVKKTTLEILECPTIRVIAIIAEGVPELHEREIGALARSKGVVIIGEGGLAEIGLTVVQGPRRWGACVQGLSASATRAA